MEGQGVGGSIKERNFLMNPSGRNGCGGGQGICLISGPAPADNTVAMAVAMAVATGEQKLVELWTDHGGSATMKERRGCEWRRGWS